MGCVRDLCDIRFVGVGYSESISWIFREREVLMTFLLGVDRFRVDLVAFFPELFRLWFIRVRGRNISEVRVVVARLPVEVQLVARDALCYQLTVDAVDWFSPV